ncbi:MAG: molecular chaperone TorD family protein [Pseudomonadota bacterium]|nr:MAG: molecular chaperone TorD family protein [Pseudomonadota bacterium]
MSPTAQTATADTVPETIPALPTEDALRANTWSLLAALLAAPPGDELLGLLRQIDPSTEGEGAMAVHWRLLRLASEHSGAAQINDEYHDCFVGISRGELMPYGSWYLTGFLMDRPLAQLRADLTRLGIARQGDVHEPEDHIAALCEVMAILISEGGHDALAFQSSFFAQHIAPWAGAFFRDVQQARSANFYRSVGGLGEVFMATEQQYLAMLV